MKSPRRNDFAQILRRAGVGSGTGLRPKRPVSPTSADVVFYDVYGLRTLTDGGTPKHYKIQYVEEPHCGSGDGLFGTLEVRNDTLVYVPR